MAGGDEEPFSTLEWAHHDCYSKPELAPVVEGPIVARHKTTRSARAPIPVYSQDDKEPLVIPSNIEDGLHPVSRFSHKRLSYRPRIVVATRCWIFIGIVALYLLVTGLGVGLGLRRKADELTSNRLLMNGTSFAAVTTDSGDRQIFFQDKSGAVRFMQYSYEKQGWSQAKATPIKASNHTPMSAFTYTLRNTTITMLHYLTQSNTLGQATYDSYSTVWTSGSIAALDSYQASPTSRSLSASPIKVNISPDEDSAHIELLIILELPGEKSIAAFAGVNNGNFTSLGSMLGIPISTPAGESWSWRVVTGSFQRLVNKDGLDRADSRYFSAPFGSTSGGFTGWWSWFYNFLSNTVIVYHVETNGTFDISKDDMSTEYLNPTELSPSDDSDIALLSASDSVVGNKPVSILYLNGTTPVFPSLTDRTLVAPPASRWPFKRFASTIGGVSNPSKNAARTKARKRADYDDRSGTFYLYHQVDENTIVEERWVSNGNGNGSWLPGRNLKFDSDGKLV